MTFSPTTAGPLERGTAAYPMNPPHTGTDGTLRYNDLVYSCEPGYRPLFLDLRLPQQAADNPYPLIVWIHGGGWMHGSRKRQAPNIDAHDVIGQLGAAGYAVALVDYRLSREAPFPAAMLDLRAAVRWLRGHADLFDIDANRIALWGESAGAHLALLTAWCNRSIDQTVGEFPDEPETVQAVVEWYGPADLTALNLQRPADGPADISGETSSRNGDVVAALLGGTSWTRADISPMNYVRADLPPTLIAHGTDDRLVPVTQSRQLHAALTAAGAQVDYIEVPGDHVFVGDESTNEVVKRGIDFLGSALPPRGTRGHIRP